jgi:hypothetical protein
MLHFRQAIKIVNSYLFIIPFLALSLSFILYNPNSVYVVVILLIYNTSLLLLSLILYIIVYGLFIQSITNKPKKSWQSILRIHWFNYFAIQILLLIPISVFSTIYYNKIIFHIYIFLVNCLSIYILPLVFLKQRVLHSISAGIKILFHTFYTSLPLLLLTILPYVRIFIGRSIIYGYHPNILTFILIQFLLNLIGVYINLLIFTTAAMIITKQGTERIVTIVDKPFQQNR